MIEKITKIRLQTPLHTFFSPAQWLVSRMGFGTKAVLLVMVVIVAFGIVVSDQYQRLNHDIQTTQQELVGLELFPPLFLVIEQMQQHRGLSSGVLNGGTELENSRLLKQRSVTRAIRILEDKLKPEIVGSADWQEIRAGWTKIQKQGLRWAATENFTAHQKLIANVLRFRILLADRFYLTSQPDIDVYYLLEAMLVELPDHLESLAQLRGVATGVLARKRASVAELIHVKTLSQKTQSAISTLGQDLEHASQLNPAIQYQLSIDTQNLLTQSSQYIKRLQTVLPGTDLNLHTAPLFSMATIALSTGYTIIYRDLVPEIRNLLDQRHNRAKKIILNRLVIAFAALLLVLYFVIGMYLAVRHSIQYISRTADQLSRGNLNRRLHMGARSELRGVANSINRLVDELTRLIRLEKENRERVQAIVDSSHDALVQLNAQGQIIGWSHQAQIQLGWTQEEVVGRDSKQVLIPESLRDQHLLRVNHFLSTGDAAQLRDGIETRILRRDGQSIISEVSLAPVRTARGYEFNVFIRDIGARKQAELREQTRRSVLEKLVNNESLSDILQAIILAVEKENPAVLCSILLLDREGKYLSLGAAPSLPDFFTTAHERFSIGKGVGCCGAAAFQAQRVIIEDMRTHPNWSVGRELVLQSGLQSCCSEPVIGADAKVLGTFAIYRQKVGLPEPSDFELIEYASQLTALAIERYRANQHLLLSSRIFAEAGEGITVTDDKGIILDVNPAFCAITGYSRAEIIGKNPRVLKSGKQSAEFYASMWQRIREQGSWQGEIWNRRKNGDTYAEMLTISSILDDQGKVTNYVGLFSDITLTKKQQKSLEFMAHYDVLTALPNRSLFADRLHQAISRSKRKDTLLAVCFLDLDNFKMVNDQHGHDTGDRLLVEVAERIRSNIREDDTACRQGGDEFILLLQELETIGQCKQMLKRICEAVARPYLLDAYQHRISVSTGVTLYPLDDAEPDMLVRHADQAMYQAKLEGKNRYHLFDVNQDQQSTSRHQQLQGMERALEAGQFCLYYQPKVNMASGEIIGAEALIRWQHPQQGLLAPDSFLPQLEGALLEIRLGDWVIEQALLHCSHAAKERSVVQVSVNISSRHLQSPGFAERLQLSLASYPDVDPACFELEILESSALGDLRVISSVIRQCREVCGVRIALDDFGTGYSSLTHMRNLPADTIKIDRSFIDCLLEDHDDYAIVDGVISLAESFNHQVLAEGVETDAQGVMLLLMGCEQAQGYAIARPMPARELIDWLHQYQANTVWLKTKADRLESRENALRQYGLLQQHWLEVFCTNIQSATVAEMRWPKMSITDSPQGFWMVRARREDWCSVLWLDRLERVQHRLFDKAQLLYGQFKQGENTLSKEDLSDIYTMADAVTLHLDKA